MYLQQRGTVAVRAKEKALDLLFVQLAKLSAKALDAGACPCCVSRLHVLMGVSIAEQLMREDAVSWLSDRLDEVREDVATEHRTLQ